MNHGQGAHVRRTVHFVAGHSIELSDDCQRATGTVCCRAEHEVGDLWVIAAIQYWDTYARRDDHGLFEDRVLQPFYVAGVFERPNGEPITHTLTNTGAVSVATLAACVAELGGVPA